MSVQNKKSNEIKKEIERIRTEYQKYQTKINALKAKQNELIKKIVEQADANAVAKIKESLQ